MKIDIGCCVDLCEARGFAEIMCEGFDEPATGLFLPPGWNVNGTASPNPDVSARGPERTILTVGFLCPRHNPLAKEEP